MEREEEEKEEMENLFEEARGNENWKIRKKEKEKKNQDDK